MEIVKCIHAITKGEESADFCKLNEHESGRLSLCTGNPCDNFETEDGVAHE